MDLSNEEKLRLEIDAAWDVFHDGSSNNLEQLQAVAPRLSLLVKAAFQSGYLQGITMALRNAGGRNASKEPKL